ncbi:MAG: ABC transporter permease [Flammeovirgaceae bacterium]|nr:ABC transporter permease [Flammeovirgaceae bacterium]
MNLSYFIAKRISRENLGGFSSTIHRIAIASIAIGLAASIVAFLVMKGFQETVQNKIYSFSGHLLISKFTMNNSPEERPFDYPIDLYRSYKTSNPAIDHIQEYSHKSGMIKTEEEVLGVVFRGVGRSFDQKRFLENIAEGSFINFPDSGYSQEVMLSVNIANKLNIKTGDDIIIHFFQNPPRFRKLRVSGLYETNLSEYFDSKIVIGDLALIQRLNDWPDSVAGGLQLFVRDVSQLDKTAGLINEEMDYDFYLEKVSEKYIQVFEWLGLISRQVNILLGVILTVVCVNMISVVLILVMERTQMIGILKAMGTMNRTIRSVFIFQGIRLIGIGLLIGNAIGLGICYLQYQFKLIPLNARDYYMSYVPISWNWDIVLWLNGITFLIVTLVLILPTMLISRIQPIQAIRFD